MVLVDNAVAEDLDWNIWRLSGGYARRIVRIRGKVVTIQLPKEVMRLMGCQLKMWSQRTPLTT